MSVLIYSRALVCVFLIYLWFVYLNSKIRYHTRKLWAFWYTQALLYVPSSFCGKTFLFLSCRSLWVSKLRFLESIACSVSFDSHIWIQKFDITRGNYELSYILEHSCMCLPHFLISHEHAMSFSIYSSTLMCAFLICGTSLLLPSCLSPWVSKSRFFYSIS